MVAMNYYIMLKEKKLNKLHKIYFTKEELMDIENKDNPNYYKNIFKRIREEDDRTELRKKIDEVYYKIRNLLSDMPYWPRRFFQRLTRSTHLADYDVFGAYIKIIKVSYPYVKQFVELKKYGVPCVFMNSPEVWDDVLNEILFAFEFYLAEDCQSRKLRKKFEKEYGEDFWDNDELKERAKDGFYLYNKHFWNLWA